MTFDEWINTTEVEESVETIDFCYHGLVWNLLELAFKAGQQSNEHE